MHPSDWVEISERPLETAAAIVRVSRVQSAGGTAVFLGTTRAEAHTDGRQLVALDYEAYPEMASAQLQQLARRARERWHDIISLAVLHRVGRVGLGEPSVLIAVATPHRAEAFEACRWLIDTLKAEAAIWKKEVWSDGSGTWSDPKPSQGHTARNSEGEKPRP